ncbi:MAG: PhzF family phenazine biosynthesis protein [Clostridia bacterium]|nr:PhzF family phenazine biosynthesis protein [Clostridia bacterium]
MKQYIVDAFSDKVFKGNPAAVCVMQRWPDDDLMQKIAIENNLSETAFVVWEKDRYRLRWFTPHAEIDLCGHATLGAAFVLANFYKPEENIFEFDTMSGRLTVAKKDDLYEMDFPSRMPVPVEVTEDIIDALNGQKPMGAYLGRDLMLVLPDEKSVRDFTPDWNRIRAVSKGMGFLITAKADGGEYDFVSRCFFPKINVNEDPVTGSAHCNFVPYWAMKLGKEEMTAHQISARGGILYCRNDKNRVILGGRAVLFCEAELHI